MKTSIMDRSKDTFKKNQRKKPTEKQENQIQQLQRPITELQQSSHAKYIEKQNKLYKQVQPQKKQQGRTISKLCMIRSHLIRKHMKARGSINKKKSEKDSK